MLWGNGTALAVWSANGADPAPEAPQAALLEPLQAAVQRPTARAKPRACPLCLVLGLLTLIALFVVVLYARPDLMRQLTVANVLPTDPADASEAPAIADNKSGGVQPSYARLPSSLQPPYHYSQPRGQHHSRYKFVCDTKWRRK